MTTLLTRRSAVAAALAFAPALASPAWARTGPESFAPLVKRVMPTVVNIAVTETVSGNDAFASLPAELQRQFRERFRQRRQQVTGAGSGFIIDAAGYIVTNNHVVGNADSILVVLSDGTELPAKLVGSDELTDVAVIKVVAPAPLPAATWGDSKGLEVGDWVVAAGNPFGLGGSVSRGILSSKSRTVPKEGEPLDIPNWLQTDAPINLGNSGGPLVNLRGELIGINVAVLNEVEGQRAQGIGFAIPIRRVLESLADIFPTEFVKAYWFGARVKVGTTPLVITSVQAQSPAGQAGLKVGDAIMQVNGKSPRSFIDFADLLAAGAGTEATLAIGRGPARKNIGVRLVPEKTVFNAGMIRDKLGLNLEELTPQLAARYGVGAAEGFLITGVEKDSPAAGAGLQGGILVTAIEGHTPADLATAAKLLYAKQKGDRVQLEIAWQQRAGNFNILRQGAVELATR